MPPRRPRAEHDHAHHHHHARYRCAAAPVVAAESGGDEMSVSSDLLGEEVEAMSAMAAVLKDFDAVTQARIITWLAARVTVPKATK